MNRSLWRKAVALTLTAAMTAGLTACGGGGNSTSADGKKRYFKADYLSDLPEHFKGNGQSILTAALLLGIMILPTIISVSESSIRAVEESYYEGALALGATHERSVFTVVVPAAKSGVFAAVVLGVGRALGETMAVMIVVGNQARVPDSIFKGVRTLTTNIVLEMGYATDLHREALIATGVVLFVFILIINISFSILKRRGKE